MAAKCYKTVSWFMLDRGDFRGVSLPPLRYFCGQMPPKKFSMLRAPERGTKKLPIFPFFGLFKMGKRLEEGKLQNKISDFFFSDFTLFLIEYMFESSENPIRIQYDELKSTFLGAKLQNVDLILMLITCCPLLSHSLTQ